MIALMRDRTALTGAMTALVRDRAAPMRATAALARATTAPTRAIAAPAFWGVGTGPEVMDDLGLHRVEITVDGRRLRVRHLEALDGTPILDVKPVLSEDVSQR